MECKKYTIIESYPSILKHSIFIIAFIIASVYFILFWIELIKTMFIAFNKSFSKGISFFKNLVILKKEDYIEGASSFKDFTFDSVDICNSKESDFNKIKEQIVETKIFYHSGIKALNIIHSLNDNLQLNLNLTELTKTNFILKEEIIFIKSEEELLKKDFILTKGYNKAAINTYNLFKKILK